MVARLPRHRMIPRHYLGVPLREFGPYLRAPFTRADEPDRQLAEFEALWAERLPQQRVVPTPLGRHALWYFIDAAGLQPGDEVLVAAYNYYVVVRLLVQKGLVPVFVDVDPETSCMDPEDLARKIGPRSRMVLVTHMFGHPADLDAIEPLCREHELLLFEDCAHAIGTTIAGQQVGDRGDGALFSFGIWKIVGTFGGGMLALRPELHAKLAPAPHAGGRMQTISSIGSRAALAHLMRPGLYGWCVEPILQVAWFLAERGRTSLRDLIAPSKDNEQWRFDEHERSPYRPFMTAMLAAQLDRIDAQVEQRRAAVEGLEQRLASLPGVRSLNRDRHGHSNGAYLGLWVPNPEALADELANAGVGANPHEFFDCSRLAQFSEFAATCPQAAEVCDHVIRMPSYAALRPTDLDFITQVIAEHLATSAHGSAA